MLEVIEEVVETGTEAEKVVVEEVSAEEVKSDFGNNLSALKTTLLEKISEFKQEFTCENADKVSELKFSFESLYNKNTQDVTTLIEDLKKALEGTDVEEIKEML